MANPENPIMEVEEVEREHEEDAAATLFEEEKPSPLPLLRGFRPVMWSRLIGNLVGAMCQATLEFGEVKKDSENPFFKSSYADLSTMIGATRSQLAKYGVLVLQFPDVLPDAKVAIWTLIAHKSSEWILGILRNLPIAKPDIQGVGSGITYGRRYSYAPSTNVAGEEDDDGNRAVGTRKEHMAKLDDQMRGQERITTAQANAFIDAAKKSKTQEQIDKYLEQLNGYRQADEIQKRQYKEAIEWAISKAPAAAEEPGLLSQLEKSVDFVNLNRELRAAATKHAISNKDIHQFIQENYHAESLKDLSAEQLRQTIRWVDEQ